MESVIIMTMITVISGDEDYLIREKLCTLLQNVPAHQLQHIDLEKKKGSLKDFFVTCYGRNLFADKMTIVLRNPYFLLSKIDDSELRLLTEYVAHPSAENDVIIYSQGGKGFDKRTKAYKVLRSNAHEVLCNQLDERNFQVAAYDAIRQSSLSISREDANLLIRRSELSLALLHRNILKLRLYNGKIDKEVVSALLPETVCEDNFALCDALIRKDVEHLFRLVEEYKKANDTILPLIALLASQLRYLYGVAFLSGKKYSLQAIADEMNSKSKSLFRVQKAKETLTYINGREILKLLEKLSLLDEVIKIDSGIPDILRFELFLVQWVNGYESN